MSEESIRSLSVSGVPYSYRVARQPDRSIEPVVALGGAMQGLHGWPPMEDRLGPLADVVTADLPGMGSAGPLPPGPSLDLLCRAVEGIVDDLGDPQINLFGYSHGASVAYAFAQRFPRRIARLVLGGPPVYISPALQAPFHQASDALDKGDFETFATMTAKALMCFDEDRHVVRRELTYRYVRRSLLHTSRSTPHAATFVRRALSNPPEFSGGLTGVPTLVFNGEHDTLTTAARQRDFAASIQGSRLVTIPDSDHWVILERAQDVADLAARFFTDAPLSSAPCLVPVAREELSAAGPAFV
ncbi:alpha/beta hydrolase [Streptomyces sp. NPDC050636]|uniref:alpha/beta fold hydrolase n=1 Tax=Streptomyces sp. NPDC050636 TaxID=3154510 RepID=UPI0034428FBE